MASYSAKFAPGFATAQTQRWLIRDSQEPASMYSDLSAHIAEEDYFVTLATILDLFRQDLAARNRKQDQKLQRLISGLTYLQENYRIVKKTDSD